VTQKAKQKNLNWTCI